MPQNLPHPIPYQGSKRMLAPKIASLLPASIDAFYEPFAGSAAMTLYAAHHGIAKRYVLGDTLEPIVDLWRAIIDRPAPTGARYAEVWRGQTDASPDYFNRVRERYNANKDPVDLLYLICRCVKNAVRFNGSGRFTQSHDKRRLGMAPDRMQTAIDGASALLRGRTELRKGDWTETTSDAKPYDFVYMDPPYMGTSLGHDKRYHRQLLPGDLIAGLRTLNARNLRFALSYDGMTGDKEYGPPLPADLGMTRMLLHAGRSSQATLQGKADSTVESLYLSGRSQTAS